MTDRGSTTVRTYRSAVRAEQSRSTRRRILAAATALFQIAGYAGTTMRAVARSAGIGVATVELAYGTKAALLRSAIDVAIAGDDQQVPVLERRWTQDALAATTPAEVLSIAAAVLASAQQRSAGLILAALEGSSTDSELGEVVTAMVRQRQTTATWLVDLLSAKGPVRPGLGRDGAIDSLWILMDPALFDRLVRQRGWSTDQYRDWFATSALHVLTPDPSNERRP